jgi:hypothetical protein
MKKPKLTEGQILFTLTIASYVALITVWCCKFPISYKLTNGTYHKLVLDHDFTKQELKGIEKAYRIRVIISKVLLYSSIFAWVVSYICFQKKWIRNNALVKIVMYVSAIIAIVLMLVNGIHFIPGPPIR